MFDQSTANRLARAEALVKLALVSEDRTAEERVNYLRDAARTLMTVVHGIEMREYGPPPPVAHDPVPPRPREPAVHPIIAKESPSPAHPTITVGTLQQFLMQSCRIGSHFSCSDGLLYDEWLRWSNGRSLPTMQPGTFLNLIVRVLGSDAVSIDSSPEFDGIQMIRGLAPIHLPLSIDQDEEIEMQLTMPPLKPNRTADFGA